MENCQIRKPKGANKNKKIVGRGRSTGWGKTCGKGHKGQKSRSGGSIRPGFEGGQMPLYRRVAVRGFSNHPFKTEYQAVNLNRLEKVYSDGEIVNLETLREKGLIKKSEVFVKILGSGDITKKLEVQIENISGSAAKKIEKAGGKVTAQKEKKERPEGKKAKLKAEKAGVKTQTEKTSGKKSGPEAKADKSADTKTETKNPEEKKSESKPKVDKPTGKKAEPKAKADKPAEMKAESKTKADKPEEKGKTSAKKEADSPNKEEK